MRAKQGFDSSRLRSALSRACSATLSFSRLIAASATPSASCMPFILSSSPADALMLLHARCAGKDRIRVADRDAPARNGAMCMGPEAHPDPARRYVAAVAAGVGYLALGILGGAVGAVLAAVPHALVVVDRRARAARHDRQFARRRR